MSTSALGGSQSNLFQDFQTRFAAFAQQSSFNTTSSQSPLTNGQALPAGSEAPANFDLSKLLSGLQNALDGSSTSGAAAGSGTDAAGSFTDLLKQLEAAASSLLLQAQEQSGQSGTGASVQHHHHHHHVADDDDDSTSTTATGADAGTSGQRTLSVDIVEASATTSANGQTSFSFQEVFASITRSFGANPATPAPSSPAATHIAA